VQLRVPVLGSLVKGLAVSRFARTLGMLLDNGIPMLSAMQISRDAVGHQLMGEAIDAAGEAVRRGLAQLRRTFANIRRYREIGRFLIARMIYTDGLNTLFAFGGIYAAGTFGMALAEVIKFGILLNVTAGLGALAFAWVDDWLGAKRTILIGLVGLLACGTAAVIATSTLAFWIAGGLLGLFVGPTQAASRSLMARMAPAELRTEMFGLYALTGKITAYIGPFLLGTVTYWTGSQRFGIATILAFFVVGGLLLLPLQEPEIAEAAA
jgi:UMF1 family MFS transporter